MYDDDTGGVIRPERDGLVSAPVPPSVGRKEEASAVGGFPTLKQAKAESELYGWLGSDLAGNRPVEEEGGGRGDVPVQAGSVRRGSNWELDVNSRKADLAALLAVSGYRFGLLTIGLVLIFRVGEMFGILTAIGLQSQILIMGVALLSTMVCGFSALGLLLRKDVARRGEKFVKRVVQLSLYSMIFMNTLLFVLIFSVFQWPDLSNLL